MKTIYKIGIAVASWSVIGLAAIFSFAPGCTDKNSEAVDPVIEYGLLRNDDLIAMRLDDGTVTIKNSATGKVTIKDIKLDWTQESSRDSLAVFSSDNKRGYYNMYTGEIAVPAQYRRAWVFSEGMAAVQKNGNIGFIDHKGNVVIDFKYPYHGNPLSEFVFDNGRCVVADNQGKCGVIDKKGNWLITPDYDNVSIFMEYAIVSKAGIRMQVDYDGTVLNSFVLDDISRLTYPTRVLYTNSDGEPSYVDRLIDTGFFSYRVGGRCGLMNSDCQRVTEPLYTSISAVDKNMFRATLFDHYSEVILNSKGEVMK